MLWKRIVLKQFCGRIGSTSKTVLLARDQQRSTEKVFKVHKASGRLLPLMMGLCLEACLQSNTLVVTILIHPITHIVREKHKDTV